MSPRRLILMRHAKAEPASLAVPDHARALTERGQGDAPRMASWLVAQGWGPQAVVCSDSTRTWQTWERMAGALPTPPELRVSRSLYLGGLSELIAHARGWPEAWTTVLAIGHNPGWEEAVTSLSGQLLAMKTAGCALLLGEGVDWSDSLLGDWRLVGAMRPRELD